VDDPPIPKANDGNTRTIAWDRWSGASPHSQNSDIWAARMTYSGFVVNPPFQITSGHTDGSPCASSPLTGTQRTMIVFPRDYGTDDDVEAVVLDGATAVQTVDVSTMVNNGFFMQNQW